MHTRLGLIRIINRTARELALIVGDMYVEEGRSRLELVCSATGRRESREWLYMNHTSLCSKRRRCKSHSPLANHSRALSVPKIYVVPAGL